MRGDERCKGKRIYAPDAIEVENVGELASEVVAKRCSPFAAWFPLRYGLRPEPALTHLISESRELFTATM